MDCTRAQELALDELDADIADTERAELQRHLATCPACAAFGELQGRLDAELSRWLATTTVGPRFRRSLERRLAEERLWPEWLPDLASLLGAGLATAACVLLLPYPASRTWWLGLAIAGTGLVLQTIFSTILEELDPGSAGS
jgi:anti-sigma factor RsiW